MNNKRFLPTFRLISSYLIKSILILLIAVLLPCNSASAALNNIDVETTELTQPKQLISEQNVGKTLAEAYLLFKQGTADSQKKAQDKWDNLLSELRTRGDRSSEAIALNEIGLAYEEAGNYWTALSYFKQSQITSRAEYDKLADLIAGLHITRAYKKLVAQDDPKAYTEFIKYVRQELDRTDKLRGNTNSSTFDMPLLGSPLGWNPYQK